MPADAREEPSVLSSRADRLSAVLGWILVGVVLCHATQFSLSLPVLKSVRAPNVSLVDALLLAAAILWAVRRWLRRDRRLPPIPWAAVIGAAWMGLSLIPSLKGGGDDILTDRKAGIVNTVQFIEYFVVAWILFADMFSNGCWRRRGIVALALAASAALGAAAVQYAAGVPVALVRGTAFANRNTLGAFLAMAVPLLFGVCLFSKRRGWGAAGAVALAGAGLCLCLSGGAWLAMAAGLLLVAALRGRVCFAATGVALAVAMLIVLPRLPRRNSDVLVDSLLLYKTSDPYKVFRDDVAGIQERLAAKRKALHEKITAGSPVGHGDAPTEEELSWKWQQRYKEWQAALNMMARSPWFGVGAGSYQPNVNPFYGAMPKYPKNLLEPDTLSGYMVWGACAGAPFLLLLAAMLLRAFRKGIRALECAEAPSEAGLAAGILGALAALVLVSVFTDPMVRGVGVSFALLLALAETFPCTAAMPRFDALQPA